MVCGLGFRIAGSCSQERRLVEADRAFLGHAACNPEAKVDQESYLSAFTYDGRFHDHLAAKRSTRGFAGPCWSRWLWFDIDREGDLSGAAKAAAGVGSRVIDRYGVDADDLLAFFSGSKGFHIGVPTSLWNPQPGVTFHRTARAMAEELAGPGNPIDSAIYDKVRAFRSPNSRHPKTGLHKVRIPFESLYQTTPDTFVKWAADPEPFEIPADPPIDQRALEDWQNAAAMIEQRAAVHRDRAGTHREELNRATMEFIREGAEPGTRHKAIYSAAANLAEFGAPERLAWALLSESGLDSGLPPREVRRQIRCAYDATKGGS